MSLRCNVQIDWHEADKETPREHLMLFLVTEQLPTVMHTGFFADGHFQFMCQNCAELSLVGTKITHFAYQDDSMLPKNGKTEGLISGWHVTKDDVPEDDEPVAIYPSFKGHQFAVWNKHEQCWDNEFGDDYLCNKDEVAKWYPIKWSDAI